MDDLLAFAEVVLQVAGLCVGVVNALVGAAALAVSVLLKENPRSPSHEDEPR